MGLYGMMRTSASGMAAQANRLATVADNIANSSTTGYKRASAEFSSLILQSGRSEYISGSVDTHIRYAVSEQGAFKFTTSVTDLGVKGNGFFVVSQRRRPDLPDPRRLFRAGRQRQSGQCRRLQADGLSAMAAATPTSSPTALPDLSRSTSASLSLQADAVVGRARSPSTCRRTRQWSSPANLPSANAAGARPTAARPRSLPTTISATR